MAGIFEKGMLAGLGLIDLSQEKVKQFVEELVERGEVSRKEGASLFQSVVERGLKEKKELEGKIQAAAEKALARMNLATRADLEKLERRLAKLEGKQK